MGIIGPENISKPQWKAKDVIHAFSTGSNPPPGVYLSVSPGATGGPNSADSSWRRSPEIPISQLSPGSLPSPKEKAGNWVDMGHESGFGIPGTCIGDWFRGPITRHSANHDVQPPAVKNLSCPVPVAIHQAYTFFTQLEGTD
ncbi:hypothetical protein B0H16DRAFT_1456183 [Mycena metata]|uniref:Uncharacterized protein n=1 Tax=Mycena metata TaxID=1033252 RepID=A0AAD7JFK1_9AGAR|nr:hypothetical protein B0H16DRAFT_1456183 [Mycena metata]